MWLLGIGRICPGAELSGSPEMVDFLEKRKFVAYVIDHIKPDENGSKEKAFQRL